MHKTPRRERHHLFLICRRAAWPQALGSLINSCRSPDDTDDTVFETEYKKLVTMPDCTKESTVKTVAKERKDTAVKTDETAFDKTLVANATAAQAAPQRLLGHSKRKQNAWEEKEENGSSLFVLSNSSYISIHTLNMQTRDSPPFPASFSLVSCISHQHLSPLQPTDSHHWLRIWHSWESEVRCSWESKVPVSPRQLVSTRRRGASDHHRFVPLSARKIRSPPTLRSEFTKQRWSRGGNPTVDLLV